MAAEVTRRTYKKGEVIIHEGDLEFCMYDIVIGSVGIYSHYGTPAEQLISTLSDGDYFGEMELISVRARSASVVALEPTEVIVIDRDTFGDFCRNSPERVLTIMQQLSDRLRKTTADYVEACKTAREAVSNARDEQKSTGWFAKLLGLAQQAEDDE